VLAAVDGDETIRILSSVARGDLPPPDAVVLDLHLAVHSGLELLGAMRRASWHTPVILMSTKVDPRVRSVAERFEVFTCLNKPLSSAQLSRTVKEALGKPPGPAA
jgi:DNA-binding NtrC family response regulator